ncbi:Endoplasmic reticulum-Golgi intermediate compartment protein 3 [Toxocara canis]|uniref:Endoplasmic reticulum-Golgi intermediate compartment protein 3 n=1 Tax=Toxocara canis TaxID=6265 RepID=A0A0B2VMI7_TOXCA|nr:Endoplasmic reticulum-Golgi intermediate compartment protein 3 [Toxocara canis]
MSLLARLRDLDAYSKPLDDFRVKTLTGGAVTLVSTVVIVILFVSETASFLSKDVVEQLFVDSTSADQRLDVNFDITFTKLPCAMVTVDVMDVSGDNQDDIQDDVYKQRLDQQGNNITGQAAIRQAVNVNSTTPSSHAITEPKCGSCYGASDGCCNTCEDVKEAYNARGWQMIDIESVEQCKSDAWVKTISDFKGEGCRVYGKVQVAKVAGNFHIAPGDALRTHRSHFHDLHSISPTKFDTAHIINHLSFGTPFPGKNYPLDGKSFGTNKDSSGIMFQYYVKVVPTMYEFLDSSNDVFSHQFSVTTHQKDIGMGASGLPGFFVQYEFSPLMVKYEERKQPLSTFLVSLCAIIGGVFTVASLIDSLIYHSSRVIQQKVELNKFN